MMGRGIGRVGLGTLGSGVAPCKKTSGVDYSRAGWSDTPKWVNFIGWGRLIVWGGVLELIRGGGVVV